MRIYSERNIIQPDPEYQRLGGVWSLEKRQLLIDTILNDFDVPKLYFHEFAAPQQLEDGRYVKYAVIDGKQRLEAIWDFIEGKFPLADDFQFFADSFVEAKGLFYPELAEKYPHLKMTFDSYALPVVLVTTDDVDLIEEMFLRLNEAVPLNAAEKRNAMGGPMAREIRSVANHDFFEYQVPFSNRRYQYREMAARFLLLTSEDNIGDTKKSYLDDMVKQYKSRPASDSELVGQRVSKVLDRACQVFAENDQLLRAQATVLIYFLSLKKAMDEEWEDGFTREQLVEFNGLREKNRKVAEKDIAAAKYELLEFDQMTLQGTNDKTSIQFRLQTLINFLRQPDTVS